MQPGICIIVPCYNESKRLSTSRFACFARSNPACRFVMVNDGSEDNTLEQLTDLKRQMPWQFDLLNLQTNSGKAEAVRQGILQGLRSNPSYIGYWDADLATPLDEIPGFAAVLDSRPEIELVLGTRLPLLGRSIQRQRTRQTIGWTCSILSSLVLGCRIRDTQCGAKLFRVNDAMRRAFHEPAASRWLFDVEIIARLMNSWKTNADRIPSAPIFEYPLQTWSEIPGSSLAASDIVLATLDLARIAWRHRFTFARRPTVTRRFPDASESTGSSESTWNKRAA